MQERRAQIVQKALQLLVEEGPNVTTLQIARAAGISEPTIFRAFADKNEVLAACFEEVAKPDQLVIELEAITHEASLADRLTRTIEAIRTHSERTGAVLNAIRLAFMSKPNTVKQREGGRRQSGGVDRRRRWLESQKLVHAAVCELLKPDEAQLRIPAADLATLVLTVVTPIGRSGDLQAGLANVKTEQLADLILHGALK
ncbi:TetR/AcrR family transcriptional regulator [Cohnella lubricantis]|uniref:TetR/AcrR family transcriptional regulator n=1 Tax=Cohnella lubricantis TaxID=2163172 RepID=A0A841TBR3_9BACL|nr:TetR/AcrR family transcriptional regulator [Cohnella lubricantis]MBB6676457.1 TetR/AcrR family transcriptional regulator [Cohnella lubricantis]MBP2117534.1 AcrR family transcriptional regulator [Cohnella lubricantis]